MHFRAQRSARMLAEDESITFEEYITDKHSSHMELADRTVDELIAAAQKSENSEAKRAAAVLAKWDRTANATSRGGVLFQAFTREFIMRAGQKRFAVRWSESDLRMTPRGLGDPQLAVEVLASASAKVTADYGAPDVTWGEVYRLRVDGYDLPANGGPGELGIFRVVNYAPDKDKRFRAEGGDSYVAAIEFSTPVRARTLMSYGNASQPGSTHRTDQLPLFARQELRTVWRTRGEIEKNLSGRQAF
jgi:acyl-homoserine-lactone acylase